MPEAPRGIAFITIGQTIAQVCQVLKITVPILGGSSRLTAIDDDPPSLEATITLFESGIGI